MRGLEHADSARLEERAELQQIGPVRLEGVAGQAPLELEVCDEIEDQRLHRALDTGRSGLGAHTGPGGAHRWSFAPLARAP